MKIVSTQFDLSHNSFEFYFSGCNFHCKNCQNEDLWDFNLGTSWKDFIKEHDVWNKVRDAGDLIKSVVLLGGEPLHQDKTELLEFLNELEAELPEHRKILFTGFDDTSQIPKDIFSFFDLIKCGKYIEELTGKNLQKDYELATTNQFFVINCDASTKHQINRRINLVMEEPNIMAPWQ